MIRRTLHHSSEGERVYAVRDKTGPFEDIRQHSRVHAMDIRRCSAAENRVVGVVAKNPKEAVRREAAKRTAVERATRTDAKRG